MCAPTAVRKHQSFRRSVASEARQPTEKSAGAFRGIPRRISHADSLGGSRGAGGRRCAPGHAADKACPTLRCFRPRTSVEQDQGSCRGRRRLYELRIEEKIRLDLGRELRAGHTPAAFHRLEHVAAQAAGEVHPAIALIVQVLAAQQLEIDEDPELFGVAAVEQVVGAYRSIDLAIKRQTLSSFEGLPVRLQPLPVWVAAPWRWWPRRRPSGGALGGGPAGAGPGSGGEGCARETGEACYDPR